MYPGNTQPIHCGQQSAVNMINCTIKDAPPVLAFDEVEKRFAAHLDHLNTLTLRLRNVGDRVFGACPEAATTNAANPNPGSVIGRLDQLLVWTTAQTVALTDEIGRLERL